MKKYKKKKGGGIVGRIFAVVAVLAFTAGAVSLISYILSEPTDSPIDTPTDSSTGDNIPVSEIILDESEVIF